MPSYDGAIRINTKINTKEASSQLLTLENRIKKTADKVTSLRSNMESLKNSKIPTQEYQEISNQIDRANAKFDKLLEKQMKMQAQGKTSGSAWENLNAEMDELGNEINYAKGELQDLVNSGKAFTLGSDTQEFTDLSQKLQYAEYDLKALTVRHNELLSKQKRNTNEYKKMSETAKKSFGKMDKSVKKTSGLFSSFASRLKGIALSLLIFNWITKAFNAMIKAIKEGFTNLYNGSDTFKAKVDSLKASCTTLKNSLAAAFSPLVEIAIPYIQRFIEWLTNAISLLGQFVAALSGQSTYTKAIKQTAGATEESAEATKDQANATEEADKANKKSLSSLDKLNVISSQKESENKDADTGAAGTAAMFEEVPVDNKVLDFIRKMKDYLKPVIDYAKQLKDIFVDGFFDGLGDWQYRWEDIKESIGSIKDFLIDIFTDPNVLSAMDDYAKSFTYMLGTFAGMVGSIGLTIATNLLGGIAKYLEQNKESIKEYLITMFDIGTEINLLFSELFVTIGYLFEAFATENAQQLTANIIGIFSEIFMGISQLFSMMSLDWLKLLIQPFLNSKEQIRAALDDVITGLMEFTGSVKQVFSEFFDLLISMYEEHISPIFERLMPEMEKMWQEHIAPLLTKLGEFFSELGANITKLWEETLKPFIQWFSENIMPVISPILEAVGKIFINLFSTIADIVGSILDVLGGLVDFIVGVFTGDWEQAWNGIVEIFTGIFNVVIDVIEFVVNAAIDLINGLIQGINNVSSKVGIPSISLLSSFEIPALATGTVVPPNAPFMAMLGDNKKETEVVSPLSTMKQAMKEALSESGYGGRSGDIVINMNGREILRVTMQEADEFYKETGTKAFA